MPSKSDSLLNLPLALNIALATVLVPTISTAMAAGRRSDAKEKVEASLLISVLFILPCAAGLIVLARPIYQMIYPNAPQGWELRQIAAVGMIFMALNQTLTGSLQGLGKVSVPAKALLFGVAAKVTLNLILIRIPSVNIYGAPVASAACYLIASSICFAELKGALSPHLPVCKYLLKLLACTVIMGIGAAAEYRFFHRLLMSNGFAVLLTVFCSVALYLLLILCARILSAEEIDLLPVSDRIKQKLMQGI
nr:polysaccharide biosynthesis C-terminal domain-containing protein [uncultured Oscillibacter sp.]